MFSEGNSRGHRPAQKGVVPSAHRRGAMRGAGSGARTGLAERHAPRAPPGRAPGLCTQSAGHQARGRFAGRRRAGTLQLRTLASLRCAQPRAAPSRRGQEMQEMGQRGRGRSRASHGCTPLAGGWRSGSASRSRSELRARRRSKRTWRTPGQHEPRAAPTGAGVAPMQLRCMRPMKTSFSIFKLAERGLAGWAQPARQRPLLQSVRLKNAPLFYLVFITSVSRLSRAVRSLFCKLYNQIWRNGGGAVARSGSGCHRCLVLLLTYGAAALCFHCHCCVAQPSKRCGAVLLAAAAAATTCCCCYYYYYYYLLLLLLAAASLRCRLPLCVALRHYAAALLCCYAAALRCGVLLPRTAAAVPTLRRRAAACRCGVTLRRCAAAVAMRYCLRPLPLSLAAAATPCCWEAARASGRSRNEASWMPGRELGRPGSEQEARSNRAAQRRACRACSP